MHEEITLTREVTAIQIPSGDSVTLPLGTPVYITQRLGGTFTVATSQGLARIPASDADALGIDLEAESRKREAAIRISDAPLEDQVWAQLKSVYDPEIPVDIVNLGLVYDCLLEELGGKTIASVKMTLTAPGCGMGPVIAAALGRDPRFDDLFPRQADFSDCRDKILHPRWNQEMISEEGRMKLGMI